MLGLRRTVIGVSLNPLGVRLNRLGVRSVGILDIRNGHLAPCPRKPSGVEVEVIQRNS